MARYRGPQTKISRTFGEPIFGYDKSLEKKPYPPGQHGVARKRKVLSEFGIQLKEKQKAKYTYGILEKQFANIYKKATSKKGITGVILLQLLEARLDNTIYRLGFAPSRRSARQLVGHKHIMVNGKTVNIPSYTLRAGDVVAVSEKSKDIPLVSSALDARNQKFPWLEVDANKMEGKFLAMPERESIPENIREQLIVELYSK